MNKKIELKKVQEYFDGDFLKAQRVDGCYRNPFNIMFNLETFKQSWQYTKNWYWNMLLLSLGFKDKNFIHKVVSSDNLKTTFGRVSQSDVTWFGHSSFLVRCFGFNFVIDPVFSPRSSPLSFMGPRNYTNVSLAHLENINVDFVLISHNHYDHMDKDSLCRIKKHNPDVLFICPVGVRKILRKWGLKNAIELNWWKSLTFELGDMVFKLTSVPAQHNSARGLFDSDRTLWCGFVVEFFDGNERLKSFYYSGDSGYNIVNFKRIGDVFGEVDLGLLPIGAYEPKVLCKPLHFNPSEAVQVHQDVRIKKSIACHYESFSLGSEKYKDPRRDLRRICEKLKVTQNEFLCTEVFETVEW